MQSQWPGLGPSFDLSSLDGAAGETGGTSFRAGGGALAAQRPDGIARPWWTCGTGASNGNAGDPLNGLFGPSNASSASLFGLVTSLVGALQQLVGAFLNQTQNPNQSGHPTPFPTGPQQQFQNVDVSSTGDPHIAETGTRAGGQAVDSRWDSMTSHADLVHSNQVEGGYRVSTAVTQPDANGVTSNQSATVHTNFDQDSVTMNRDGSFAIFDDGEQVQLGKGESATLSGGEQVTVNQDGSLKVSASNGSGGTIATTLRSTGAGVDVTTHAHDLALGGDAVTHGAHGGQRGHQHHHRGNAHLPPAIDSVFSPVQP